MQSILPAFSCVRSWVIVLGLIGLACSAPAGAGQEEGGAEVRAEELYGVPDVVRTALLKGEFERALAELESAKSAEPAQADWWTYLRGSTLVRAGKLDEALAEFDAVEKREPASVFRLKARFSRAEALRALGRHAEAEAVYEAEATRLLSEKRQEELAAIYFEIADRLSTPPKSAEPGASKLDYDRAVALYAKVLDLDVSAASRERALSRSVTCREAQQRWDHVAALAQRYADEFTPTEVEPGRAGEHVFEIALSGARARIASGELDRARRDLEDLSAAIESAREGTAPWSDWRKTASEAVLARTAEIDGEARFAVASTYPFDDLARGPLAIAALERFLAAFPEHPRAFSAAFAIGERHQKLGRTEQALAAFEAVIARTDPTSKDQQQLESVAAHRRNALFRKGQLLATLERSDAAIAAFQEYVARFPTGPDWTRAQQAIVDTEYAVGTALWHRKEFAAARASWAAFLARHPLDARAEGIESDIAMLYGEEVEALRAAAKKAGREAPEAEVRALLEANLAEWRRLSVKYPGTNVASQALVVIGSLEEREFGRLEAAVEAYRQCTFGSFADDAAEHLARMTEPSLTLATERTYRTNESPKVKLDVRNVEELVLEIYAVDLEAYFRKNLTHQRIEDLDLDLIAADRKLTQKVEGFAKYKPISREIELPVKGPGVWAVALTAEGLRATTLVIASDIDVLVRSSGKEAVVFAEDMLARAAAKDVRVVLAGTGADGSPSVTEVVTGADGTAKCVFENLGERSGLEVLALRNGHVASNAAVARQVSAVPSLSARGVVYTDRPVYRPGETVSWRALVRDVVDGKLDFERGGKLQALISDSQAQIVASSKTELSAFGTAHGEFALDPLARLGRYKLTVFSPAGAVHAGWFEVQHYRAPRVQLELAPEREVYFRGERVSVVATASYYWGEPLVRSQLLVDLPDQRRIELTTDEKGEAKFEFPTRDYASEQALAFSATLPQEQVSATGRVVLAIQEYRATLEVERDIVLAGSSFDVELTTRGADGEPVGKTMTLSIRRRESDGSTWSEVEIEKREIATDPKTGIGHAPIRIDKGGHHSIEASATDRFGNPVQDDDTVFVSGDDDEQRLRFVVTTHRLNVGERAALQVVHRAEPGLALVTFETDTILEHRVVRLERGTNEIALDVGDAHFPGFRASASLMAPGVLHEDAIAFDVSRALTLKIEPDRAAYRPGERAKVRIVATDQLGRPVRGEFSLAVVDEALYDVFPDRTRALSGLFDRPSRSAEFFVSTSSCAFRYDGETRWIPEAVLQEAERLERERNWKDQRQRAVQLLDQVAAAPGAPAPSPSSDDFFAGAGLEPQQEAEGGTVIGTPSAFASRRGGGRGQGGGGGRGGSKRAAGASEPPEFDNGLAYWSPNVTTDAKGEALLEFELPSRSTTWRLVSRGCDAGTLAGDARATLVSKDEFFVELISPAMLTEGDQPRFVARLHNLTGMTGSAKLTLRVAQGDSTKTYPQQIELGATPDVECVFPAIDAVTSSGALAVSVEAEGELSGLAKPGTLAETINARPYRPSTTARADLAVRPWGIEVADSRSGVLRADAAFTLKLDPKLECTSRRLEVTLGPSVDALLDSTALGEGMLRSGGDANSVAAAELLGVCELLELVHKSGRVETVPYGRLVERAQGLVTRLLVTQAADGSWSFQANQGVPHLESSAFAMLALAAARARGLEVADDALGRGVARLSQDFREASQQADEVKALLSWALAAHEAADFGALNRLHRQRASLSPAALAYTALALARMERLPMAREVADVLEERTASFETLDKRPACSFTIDANGSWARSRLEMTALAALALAAANPMSEKLAPAVEFLLAHQPWSTGRGRGLCVAAIARFGTEAEPLTQRLQVTVIAGGESKVALFTPERPGTTLSFDVRGANDVAVELRVQGRGQPHFSAVLRGFTSKFEVTNGAPRAPQHDYLAAPARYRGAEIPWGFSVLADSRDQWRNTVAELGHGALARCRLDAWIPRETSGREDDPAYWTAEIPIPAGTRVMQGSWSCSRAESFDLDADVLRVHLGELYSSVSIEYTLIGAVPGAYRALPAVFRSAYEPDRTVIVPPTKLAVLARGETSRDAYRPTPDELYHLGQAKYAAGEREAARELLQALIDGFEAKLREQPLAASATSLLFANIERRAPRDIVRYFEVLKEKDPDVYVPFEKVLAVGAAYREIEEHERALTIFRATIEETFGKELQVVGALEEQRELGDALETLAKLCREYPDASRVLDANLSLSDKLLDLAPLAHKEPSLTKSGHDRLGMLLAGIVELQRFLALHTNDPRAPDAALNLVTAHLALDDYRAVSKLGGEFAAAYTEPRFADAFAYSRAVAEWYLGKDAEARTLLDRIANAEYTAKDGTKSPSPNRDLALYILGQIHHARQEFADAARYYERVQEVFADARDTLVSLREKRISLPEVTEVRPGSKVDVEITHRNIAQAELLVYPVDLMTLYLREKNLSKIAKVNLSGIAPTVRRTVELAAKESLRPATTKVAVELKDAGAYLVICRGDDLHASGLVLVSDIALDVKENVENGQLRVQATEHGTNRFLRNVDVRVIGALNADFISGRTDPRGLFVAEGLTGNATVIARSGERQYAFYRGAVALAVADKSGRPRGQTAGKTDYLSNLGYMNEAAQNERGRNLEAEIRADRKGVQIRTVK